MSAFFAETISSDAENRRFHSILSMVKAFFEILLLIYKPLSSIINTGMSTQQVGVDLI